MPFTFLPREPIILEGRDLEKFIKATEEFHAYISYLYEEDTFIFQLLLFFI